MTHTVQDILQLLDQIAPPELAEDYDNVGLLAGRTGRAVTAILMALDLTEAVVDEAVALGAELIVTHHPILFHARKNLQEDDAEGALLNKLVRAEKCLIAVHTNFDNAQWGTSDVLAEALGLSQVRPLLQGLRVGRLTPPLTPRELTGRARERLGGAPRLYARDDEKIDRVAVCGGAGGSFHEIAREAGAQLYLTGEINYHAALDALSGGMAVIEAGHYETENGAVRALSKCLQTRLNALQYNVAVYMSGAMPFRSI